MSQKLSTIISSGADEKKLIKDGKFARRRCKKIRNEKQRVDGVHTAKKLDGMKKNVGKRYYMVDQSSGKISMIINRKL